MTETRHPWWRRWIINPILLQISKGASPGRLSWAVALGMVVGVFPILGSTSLLCFLVGWWFNLNQPVLHLFKSLVYPLHLALILVFIHLGQRLFGSPILHLSIPQLLERFRNSPSRFVSDFGLAAVQGVVVWLFIAPFAAILIRMAARPALVKLSNVSRSGKES